MTKSACVVGLSFFLLTGCSSGDGEVTTTPASGGGGGAAGSGGSGGGAVGGAGAGGSGGAVGACEQNCDLMGASCPPGSSGASYPSTCKMLCAAARNKVPSECLQVFEEQFVCANTKGKYTCDDGVPHVVSETGICAAEGAACVRCVGSASPCFLLLL